MDLTVLLFDCPLSVKGWPSGSSGSTGFETGAEEVLHSLFIIQTSPSFEHQIQLQEIWKKSHFEKALLLPCFEAEKCPT